MLCLLTGNNVCLCTLKEKLRKLFTEHAVYTKFYITSASSNLPDLSFITARLLQNQTDIGNAVKPIIGDENGNKLTQLLKEHILAAANAISTVKLQSGTKDAINKVLANSKLVAEFLSKLSPKLNYDVVLKEFNQHNQYVIDITILHFEGKYEQEIKMYDAYYNHMLMFSDLLNSALSKQTGGSYYDKYKKYKIKYKKLKK